MTTETLPNVPGAHTDPIERPHTCPRIFRVWEERLDGEVIPRGLIQQWTNHIAAMGLGYEPGGFKSNLDPGHAATLMEIFDRNVKSRNVYQLTPDHAEFGRKWLETNLSKAREHFPIPSEFTMERFRGFRWVGVHVVHVNDTSLYWMPDALPDASIVPVWEVQYAGEDGKGTFTYHWQNWQAGAYQ